MLGIPDSFGDSLVDPFNHSASRTIQQKTSDSSIEPAYVTSYDPLTHTAMVKLARFRGAGPSINVKIQEHYQGTIPGSGEASSYRPGQLVDVMFLMGSASGLFNHGTIVGTRYTHKDDHAPAYAPWAADGTGTVKVHPTKDGKWGNAEHTDAASNVSRTIVAKTNTEDWGNDHTIVNGPNITRSEELTRRSADGMSAAARKLA